MKIDIAAEKICRLYCTDCGAQCELGTHDCAAPGPGYTCRNTQVCPTLGYSLL